jgi:hypothetical protein
LRFPKDDGVDRPDLEAQQCVEVTGTNTPNKQTPKPCRNDKSRNGKHTQVRVHYAVSDTTPTNPTVTPVVLEVHKNNHIHTVSPHKLTHTRCVGG